LKGILQQYETYEQAKKIFAEKGRYLTSITWILYVSRGIKPKE
jgi:hypothetical protein